MQGHSLKSCQKILCHQGAFDICCFFPGQVQMLNKQIPDNHDILVAGHCRYYCRYLTSHHVFSAKQINPKLSQHNDLHWHYYVFLRNFGEHKKLVKYILWSVCPWCSPFSPLTSLITVVTVWYHLTYVFLMIRRIFVLHVIIFIKSKYEPVNQMFMNH